ncbi:MAG: RNA polymerase factor sigma-54 [Fidelibacterota bacterium]
MAELKQVLEQRQKLTPQQILQTVLLQVNTVDLEERIVQELAENPLLEVREPPPEKGEERAGENETDPGDDGVDWEDLTNSPDDFSIRSRYDRSQERREIPLPDRPDPIDGLLGQIRMMDLSDEQRLIAEEIAWNIDERGYLATDVELIADKLGVSVADVENVLKKVQTLDPVGIGSRTLQECLQVQLQETGQSDLALRIVSDHFDDFANRRFEKLQQETGCSQEELGRAMEVISRLNPKPGAGAPTTDADYIIPDLIVERVDGELVVTVNDSRIPELQMSPVYLNLLRSGDDRDPEVKKFLRKKFEAARWFIQAVEHRQMTMLKVMKAIIDHQKDFFSGDTSILKPMILKDIAEKIDMDVSTVSRVTRGKYVQTPYGTFELKYFFSEGMATSDGEEVSTKIVKEELRKVIDGEDKRAPYSDDKLADIMKKKGYVIARRTVAKYREQMKIPVARLRREL